MVGNDGSAMASLLSPRRPDGAARHRVVLEASEAVRDAGPRTPTSTPSAGRSPRWSAAWPPRHVGWVLVAGLVVLRLAADRATPASAARALRARHPALAAGRRGRASRVGTAAGSASSRGALTALLAALLWRFGGYAARRVRPDQTPDRSRWRAC